MDKEKIQKYLKDFIIVLIGSILMSFAMSFCFINYKSIRISGISENGTPIIKDVNGILGSGTSTFALIIRNLFFKNNESSLLLENISTITTISLFVVGVIFLGKRFAIQTLLSSLFSPVFMYMFKLSIFDWLHNQFCLLEPMLCALIGGAILGAACGIIYKIGGSTGGFDIPGLIINKYFRLKLSIIFFIQDGLEIMLALIADYSLYDISLGILSVFSYSIVVEATQRIGLNAYCFEIISDKWEQINQEIIALNRGTTLVHVLGGYTNKERVLIKTMVGQNQYVMIIDIVKRIDPNAFVTMTKSNGVFGEGYTDIKEFSNK